MSKLSCFSRTLLLASLLLSVTSCITTTTVENIPPGGIAIEHTSSQYRP